MTQGEHWSPPVQAIPAADPGDAEGSHEVVFELDDPAGPAGGGHRGRRRSRLGHGHWAVVVIVLLAAALVAWAFVRITGASGGADDYTGAGFGTVKVTVDTGDTASDIADALAKAGVVKTAQAFVSAADSDPRSTGIQPGTYVLHHHMSGRDALQLLLDPAARDTAGDTVVTEGSTMLEVRQQLVKVFGSGAAARIDDLLASPAQFTLPRNYSPGDGGKLSSLEGFLFPATYTFDRSKGPGYAIQSMISQFTTVDRQVGFAADADASKVYTPYEALIIASLAQAEAKFPTDMPKVVQTILNRLKLGRSLQFDSTSAYACKMNAIRPCIYASVQSPYNTYRNHGLPPTPIDNPGAAALKAAVHPTVGNWLYFVTKDKAGHLFFTNSEQAFAAAVKKCQAEHWGCGT